MIATSASAVPMGAQVYEEQVASRAADALSSTGGSWRVDRFIARSLRSTLPGTARVPVGRLARAGRRERAVLGRLLYPGGVLVHRMDLGLPPARAEVLTMHDTVAWRFPDEGARIASAGDELREAAAVICVSQHTAEDVAEMFGVERLHVAHLGIDERFDGAEPLSMTERESLGITGRYVLHAGGATQRKNLEGLAGAWERLQDAVPDVTLVLSGPPHPRRDGLFRELPRALRVGRLPGGMLPRLMAGASAVVVPSLYEGFGLPVLEAMAAGAPVVAARTSSLPEIAGGAAILVDPTPDSIAEGVRYALSAEFDRDAAVAAGRARAAEFTWERSLRIHADVWRAASGGDRPAGSLIA
ncbi:glycosyltransferase family 4 protein [Microbacterium ulmi]|uniref:glycosyltransferase family 4 protein n=1 Tax=Microbacterium ulmi TaxID=179095 RepID=UPI0031331D5E|nr:glycosyltransferase involved in cell wall biosynthesis [Microbacterium ulmi]